MKYYIIAGEASGDLHASNLLRNLKDFDKNAEFRGWGGDLMQNQGVKLVKHYKDTDFMGFVEVLLNLRTILSNIKFCKKDIAEYKPDAIILIDYPGFNLRIAEYAHENGIKVFYYIAPQVWAWKQKRVHKIKKVVDHLFPILPFEKEFYKKFDYDVDYEGHPLLDAFNDRHLIKDDNFIEENNLGTKPIIAVLPGSRKQEISKNLTEMLKIIPKYPNYEFVIAGAKSVSLSYLNSFVENDNVKIVHNKTYDLLEHSQAAIVCSGTATLETALFEVPQVVCYKTSAISFAIAKRLAKVKYISLVNLIMDQPVVTELIQNDMQHQKISEELDKILSTEGKEIMIDNYKELKEKLGGGGASKRVAQKMFFYLNEIA